jgi:hypothetical protein
MERKTAQNTKNGPDDPYMLRLPGHGASVAVAVAAAAAAAIRTGRIRPWE